MTHNPDNKDCPLDYIPHEESTDWGYCTCAPSRQYAKQHLMTNENCPQNKDISELSEFESWACSCPPPEDTEAQIRAEYMIKREVEIREMHRLGSYGAGTHKDLLTIIDELRAEIYNLKTIVLHLDAETMKLRAELEALNKEVSDD
jgi:hypothetical protein